MNKHKEALQKIHDIIEADALGTKPTKHNDCYYDLLQQLIPVIDEALQSEEEKVTGETSDGYHTFNELYEFRKVYNAALFNEWAAQGKYGVHKSIRHHDGEECFGGGWFIVVAILPTGQISNHYEMSDWDLFQVPEFPFAQYEFDGHTPQDVVTRLKSIPQSESEPSISLEDMFVFVTWYSGMDKKKVVNSYNRFVLEIAEEALQSESEWISVEEYNELKEKLIEESNEVSRLMKECKQHEIYIKSIQPKSELRMYTEEEVMGIVSKVAFDVRSKGFSIHSVSQSYARAWVKHNQDFLQSLKPKTETLK